jgi:hypothetical protein
VNGQSSQVSVPANEFTPGIADDFSIQFGQNERGGAGQRPVEIAQGFSPDLIEGEGIEP